MIDPRRRASLRSIAWNHKRTGVTEDQATLGACIAADPSFLADPRRSRASDAGIAPAAAVIRLTGVTCEWRRIVKVTAFAQPIVSDMG